MKLTFPQKIAITLSLLWVSYCVLGAVMYPDGKLVATTLIAVLVPLFILWISGALKPLIQWFKGTEQ